MSTNSELHHLFRALKAPAAARALPKLTERARSEEWSYERFTEALLSTEVASRDASGGELRIKAARFPQRKTLEEFDFTFQRSVKKTLIQHLGQLDFPRARENVLVLGPPGTGKTHLAIALGIRACLAGQRTSFATATEWVARLGDAQRQGRLAEELRRLERIALLIVDEVGYQAIFRSTPQRGREDSNPRLLVLEVKGCASFLALQSQNHLPWERNWESRTRNRSRPLGRRDCSERRSEVGSTFGLILWPGLRRAG
jgi:hypothetical protein